MVGPVKVLVVDDEPVNLTVVSKIVQSAGYVVLQATTGLQCLEVVEREQGEGRTRDLRSTLAQMQLGYAQAVHLAGAAPAARPQAEALGLTPHLEGVERMLLEGNGAQQQVKAHLEGETLPEVFAGTVRRAHAIAVQETAATQEDQA